MQQAVSDLAPDPSPNPLAADLLALMERMREQHDEDPFGNPVLSVSLAISRRIDRNELSDAEIAALIGQLRDLAFTARAARIGDYLGGIAPEANAACLSELADRLVRPDPADSSIPLAA